MCFPFFFLRLSDLFSGKTRSISPFLLLDIDVPFSCRFSSTNRIWTPSSNTYDIASEPMPSPPFWWENSWRPPQKFGSVLEKSHRAGALFWQSFHVLLHRIWAIWVKNFGCDDDHNLTEGYASGNLQLWTCTTCNGENCPAFWQLGIHQPPKGHILQDSTLCSRFLILSNLLKGRATSFP